MCWMETAALVCPGFRCGALLRWPSKRQALSSPAAPQGQQLLSRCLSAPDNGAEKKQTPSPDRGWFIADNDVSLCMNYSVSQRARG